MAVGAATLGDMAAMADAGHMEVPARLHLDIDNFHPEAGSRVLLRWRTEGQLPDGVHLLLPDGRRQAVRPEGEMPLEVGGEPLMVALVSAADRVEARIEPWVTVPRVHLDAPAWVLEQAGTLRWRTEEAVAARLRLSQGAEAWEEEVAPDGEFQFVPRSLAPIHIELEAASRHGGLSQRARARQVLAGEVRPITPVLRHWHVGRGVLGEPARIEWELIDTESAWIEIDGDRREVAAVGSLDFIPRQLGALELVLSAHSRHAPLSPLARIENRQWLQVVAPPVEITLLCAAEQWLPPGAEACFEWTIRGAAHAWLEAPGRGERHDLPLAGRLFVPVEVMDESFAVRAAGHDGREKLLATFLVHPAIPDISAPLDELAPLFIPLDEIDLLKRS